MGAFLFYLFKSALCLTTLYFVFRLCFRSDTLFRTNRLLLLGGTLCCLLLPFVQLSIPQASLWQKPMTTVETLLTTPPLTSPSMHLHAEGTEAEQPLPPTATVSAPATAAPAAFSALRLITWAYTGGGLLTLAFFLLSMLRMRQLFCRYPSERQQGFRLIVCPLKKGSFSWGRTIVLSQEDYRNNREAILLHEQMHLHYHHTADLLWMQAIIVLHWFNPAAWLLMRELREVHEFEADNGVLLHGIDATQYQLLLVKKSVGTKLYSMASGFGHSKLKQRINMMLKKRTNRLARLKLLLFVPVVSGTLYAFARPEVKNAVEQMVKPPVGTQSQDTVRLDERELLEQYFARKFKEGGGTVAPESGKAAHRLLVNLRNQVMIDQEGTPTDCADFIRKHLTEVLRKDYQQAKQSGQPFRSSLEIIYDRGSSAEAMRLYLYTVKEVYQQLRQEAAAELGTTDEAVLDKAFPILVTFAKPKTFRKTDAAEKLPIQITLIASNGPSKTLSNFTLDELRNEVEDFRSKHGETTVSLKVEQDIPMGMVMDVKGILRQAYVTRLNYSSAKAPSTVEETVKKP
ncbi:M56 family metallopeptidase [Bacteroides sp.]|uniref:M56 family metallopeptidase n=1 Tax=Bacteroides sp. TaxID=29523 RepID=UPI0025876D70|nr:M56 family metallopeptidase [Bacteroides sp.]